MTGKSKCLVCQQSTLMMTLQAASMPYVSAMAWILLLYSFDKSSRSACCQRTCTICQKMCDDDQCYMWVHMCIHKNLFQLLHLKTNAYTHAHTHNTLCIHTCKLTPSIFSCHTLLLPDALPSSSTRKHCLIPGVSATTDWKGDREQARTRLLIYVWQFRTTMEFRTEI